MRKNIFLFITLLLLIGCSEKPSQSEIEKLINEKFYSNELYDVENLKKVNGYQHNNTYVVELEYDMVFKLSLRDLAEEAKKMSQEERQAALLSGFMGEQSLFLIRALFGDFKKGDRFNKKEEVTLINTEKGWRIYE